MTATAHSSGPNAQFWKGLRVFVTGHTGFKGGWLVAMLSHLGADIRGYAQEPDITPSLFDAAGIESLCRHQIGDLRDADTLRQAIADFKPDVVIHMAAQSLVRRSYRDPLETVQVNVLGTANVLEACRATDSVRAVVNITTDKCYENRNQTEGYVETDRLGGRDPYSASKACSEILTHAWRDSFFGDENGPGGPGLKLASARAGNVIGGGDWCEDRIIPDAVRAFGRNETLTVRNGAAVRPWQHVLEPVSGYLMLAGRLVEDGGAFARGWNFGPEHGEVHSVAHLVEAFARHWPGEAVWENRSEADAPHEALTLVLDSSQAQRDLNWHPRLGLDGAARLSAEWYAAHAGGADRKALATLTERQITGYLNDGS